jgi:phosphoesterase RecJ-like protein
MMKTEDIEGVKQLLSAPKKIVIIPHRNPDGDAMGSNLGLYHFLKKKGHEVTVISPNEYPDFLAFLPASDTVAVFEKKPDGYAAYMFSDTSYGSTCEMVYHFIDALNEKQLIDVTVATCLYTGIVTDSGSFRFNSTTGTTHRIVAGFIDLGVDNAAIHSLLFDNHTPSRIQILARALQNMKVLPEYKTSFTSLSQDELNSFGHNKGDTEGIVNYGLSMKGIDFTAFFTENKEEGIIKISFRSKGDFDVNAYARQYFNGGGHINAAGGKSTDSLEATIQKFIATLAHIKFD